MQLHSHPSSHLLQPLFTNSSTPTPEEGHSHSHTGRPNLRLSSTTKTMRRDRSRVCPDRRRSPPQTIFSSSSHSPSHRSDSVNLARPIRSSSPLGFTTHSTVKAHQPLYPATLNDLPHSAGLEEDPYDEDEDEDDDETIMTLQTPFEQEQYDQLSSLRGPCPDITDLFAKNTPLPKLPSNVANLITEQVGILVPQITTTLVYYRDYLDQWQGENNADDGKEPQKPTLSVLKASALVHQCLMRMVVSLQPIEWAIKRGEGLGATMKELETRLQASQITPGNHLGTSQVWEGLCRLSDQACLLEDSLSDLSLNINEACDWVDSFLTPVLAELKLPNSTKTSPVNRILDVHSYLCMSMAHLAHSVSLIGLCVQKISQTIEQYKRLLYCGSDDEGGSFDVQGLKAWAGRWHEDWMILIAALTLLCSGSHFIQQSSKTSSNILSY